MAPAMNDPGKWCYYTIHHKVIVKCYIRKRFVASNILCSHVYTLISAIIWVVMHTSSTPNLGRHRPDLVKLN